MRYFIIPAILIFTVAAFAQEVPEKVRRGISVVSSQDAEGSLNAEELRRCFWLLLQQQGLSDREPPKILVVHISKAEAAVAGVYDHVVRFDYGDHGEESYYQVWLVGNFKAADYVVALQAILRKAFALQSSEAEEKALLVRVLRAQAATFSATNR